MGGNLYKLTKTFYGRYHHVDFITSSKCDGWKSRRFSRVFAEYLKNGPSDFHQTYVIFRLSSSVP